MNASLAASGGSQCEAGGCPSCVKTGLPMLLVRPGIAKKSYASSQQGTIAPLLNGLGAPVLQHSGHVMRTLRRGYLFAYYEKPHTPEIIAQGGWQAFKVDDGGYLTPHALGNLPLSGDANDEGFRCERSAGYAAAMLFVIPDAKNTKRVWVGYSDHPWSETVRINYAADEALRTSRMACIDAPAAACDRSLPLQKVPQAVADYADGDIASALEGCPFPALFSKRNGERGAGFKGARGESAEDLFAQAQAIIDLGGRKYKAEDAMIVSVPDAVGATTEAAHLRISLCNEAANWVQLQAGRDPVKANWMLKSALSVDGLLKILEEQGTAKKADYASANYAQYDGKQMHWGEFNAMKSDGRLPPDADFTPQVGHDGMARFPDYSKPGYVTVPDAAQIDRETGDLKQSVLDKLAAQGGKPRYRTFLDTYNAKVNADMQRLASIEKDYGAWLGSEARKLVTTNDFDENSPFDGVHYCGAVSMLTYGGPLTDNGLEWYADFLTDAPEEKENLLLRAQLGNQQSAFADWVAKRKGPYGQLKTVISQLEKIDPATLSEEAKRWHARLPYFKVLLAGYANPVLAVTGAVATGLHKRKQITAAFRQRIGHLAGLLGGQSAGAGAPALVTLKLPLPDAARIWRQQIGALQSSVRKFASTVKGERVQSLVLGGAIAMEARGATGTADAMIDVYLWVSDIPESIGDALEGADDLPTRIAAGAAAVVRPAAANLNQAWQGAARVVTRAQLDRLARNSIQLASNGSALLATGSGVFSALALVDAWDKFEHGSTDERQKAAASLLTSGLGLSAALMSVGAEAAEQASRQALKESLKRRAGIVGAVATVIDSVTIAITSGTEFSRGDADVGVASIVQAALLLGAGGAGIATALGAGSTAVLGLSVTGWGLVLVALGIIAGFVVAALQDTPTEEWATRSFWGEASDKWGGHQREQEELNKLLLGIRVDFDFRSRFTNTGNYGRALKRSMSPLGNFVETVSELWNGERVGPQVMREAWIKVMLPEPLEASVPWVVRIVARRTDGEEARVAYYAHRPDGGAWVVASRNVRRGNDIEAVAPTDTSVRENGIWTVEMSAQLDVEVYEDAWAEVLIYGDPEADGAPLVNQTLRGE